MHNIPDASTESSGTKGNYVEIVGNGLDVSRRSNARTLDWEGNEEVAGDIIAYGCGGANPISLADIKSKVLGAYPTDTATGHVVEISDGAENIPVKNFVINIEPVQSGSGDPSPDNVRPISGWTGANVNANGTTIPITFPSEAGTVYGGALDVTRGLLSVCPYYAAYAGEPLAGPWVSSRDVYAPGATPTAGAQVVHLGGATTDYQLNPVEVLTLLGANTFSADSGETTVTYRADPTQYIARKIAEAVST